MISLVIRVLTIGEIGLSYASKSTITFNKLNALYRLRHQPGDQDVWIHDQRLEHPSRRDRSYKLLSRSCYAHRHYLQKNYENWEEMINFRSKDFEMVDYIVSYCTSLCSTSVLTALRYGLIQSLLLMSVDFSNILSVKTFNRLIWP